jgi:hypothetical protein
MMFFKLALPILLLAAQVKDIPTSRKVGFMLSAKKCPGNEDEIDQNLDKRMKSI